MNARKVFYWNCADNKNHTHKRIEWAIENGYLVCINITIEDKLFNKVKKNDIILAYEPKGHKLSNFENGDDGFCMSCNYNSFNGKQAFTEAFTVIGEPIKFSIYDDYKTFSANDANDAQTTLIFRNWYSDIKHCKNILTFDEFIKTYFENKKQIYLFPISYSGKLKTEISTAKYSAYKLIYYGNMRKGFNIIDDMYINNLILHNKLF